MKYRLAEAMKKCMKATPQELAKSLVEAMSMELAGVFRIKKRESSVIQLPR